ncbi:IS91 family transposase [Agaribacter flavus]|uniref:IS91 family transposase n=1 Tax=Agaribacter flavus TaxID=1902781 RepID=A0ABV7FVS6_9ALTE
MGTMHLSDIFTQALDGYQQSYRMSLQQHRACRSILACRTGKLGYQIWQCNHCAKQIRIGCSCRDRHCPRCQGKVTQEWVEKQSKQVVTGDYFHLVFTLPHELNVLAQHQPNAVYASLFKSVWQTMQKFTAKRYGRDSKLGMLSVLHTWGQNLGQHIHLHCLVPAGVLNREQRWCVHKKRYLYPVKALSAVFRGKMMALLMDKGIDLNTLHLPEKWCVYAKQSLHGTKVVLRYLARYTRKGMMAESRLLSYSNDKVRFKYKDYRDNKHKVMTLESHEFIRRYLLHVLPKGFMRIRYYGFLANACRQKKVASIQKQQGIVPKEAEQEEPATNGSTWPCSECKLGHLMLSAIELPTLRTMPFVNTT